MTILMRQLATFLRGEIFFSTNVILGSFSADVSAQVSVEVAIQRRFFRQRSGVSANFEAILQLFLRKKNC